MNNEIYIQLNISKCDIIHVGKHNPRAIPDSAHTSNIYAMYVLKLFLSHTHYMQIHIYTYFQQQYDIVGDLKSPQAKTRSLLNASFFLQRVAANWNSQPTNLKYAPDLNSFKKSLIQTIVQF